MIKQRSQTGTGTSFLRLGQQIYHRDGWRGLYRGFAPLLAREMPFSFIELPIWEYFKREYPKWAVRIPNPRLLFFGFGFQGKDKCTPFESAVAGSSAGCIAAVVTTPLDVIKTRVMLSEAPVSSYDAFLHIRRFEGVAKLFAGTAPRTLWMGFGGFIFFFAYELTMSVSYQLF